MISDEVNKILALVAERVKAGDKYNQNGVTWGDYFCDRLMCYQKIRENLLRLASLGAVPTEIDYGVDDTFIRYHKNEIKDNLIDLIAHVAFLYHRLEKDGLLD